MCARARAAVLASVNRLTSAYIFRLFRNSLRSILRSRRFTGYGTASKGEGNIRHFDSGVPARRERPEFHVRLVASTTVRFVGRLRHYSPSLSICLSLSFLSDNERQNESFLSSWPSLDRRKNWQGEGFLGRDAPYLFSLRRIEIESVLDAGMKFDFFAAAHGRNSIRKVFTPRMERNHRLRLRINE